MLPIKIEGATHVLGKDQEGVRELHAKYEQGIIATAWEPTPDELLRLNSGAPVYLLTAGGVFPPTKLGVGHAMDNPPPLAPETCPLCRTAPKHHDSTTRDVMGFALATLAIVQKGGSAPFMVKTAMDDLRKELGE